MHGKVTHPARNFVETFFGRGSASGPITTNPRTHNVACERRGLTQMGELDALVHGGRAVAIPKTRKTLVYVKRRHPGVGALLNIVGERGALAFMLSHELSHRGVNHYYLRKHNRLPSNSASEVVAYMSAFLYLRQRFPSEYLRLVSSEKEVPLNKIWLLGAVVPATEAQVALFVNAKLPQDKLEVVFKKLLETDAETIQTSQDTIDWAKQVTSQNT